MANTGDSFIVKLTSSQLGWGTKRYTASRDIRYGEGYLSIPRTYAELFSLYNSNHTKGRDILGKNIFHCISSDGLLDCELKSQGCVSAGDKYAKQFAGSGNLRALGDWYSKINAKDGDKIKVYFSSPTDIELTLIQGNFKTVKKNL